jgi:putative nucleotidyltransferase with HDIG domain
MYQLIIRIKRFITRVLKVQADTRQEQPSRTSSKIYKYLMLLIATILIAFLYPAEDIFRPLDSPRQGELAQKDIIAPVEITLTKSEGELEEERQAAINSIPTIIDYNDTLIDTMLARFDRFMRDSERTQKSIERQRAVRGDTSAAYRLYVDSAKQVLLADYPILNRRVIEQALRVEDYGKALRTIKAILADEIYFAGVISDTAILPEAKNRSVIIRIDKRDMFSTRDKLQDISKAYKNFLAALNSISRADSVDVDKYYDLGRYFIMPNLRVNNAEIRARQVAAAAKISSVKETVNVGDVIVRAGQIISKRQAEIMAEMYRQQRLESAGENRLKYYLPALARFLLVLAAFVLMYLYLYYFHNKIFQSNPKLLALFFIYGLELLFIYVIGIRGGMPIYLYPIPIFSILITVLYDAEIGTFNTFILALLLGVLHRFNFPLVLVTIIVGMVAAYSIQKVSHRTGFFKTILYTGITYIALVLLLESFNITPDEDIVTLAGYGLLNAVFAPLLAMGILPLFESLFGFTTNITLLELSDMNHPLLKRLSMEAPGTYHHSLMVGNLAEAAAKAIDANPLLARVGAYYHDIGKMEIPEYFVENQLGIKSKHDALTPSMSSIILTSHIKKGRRIGERADLPNEVLNFIEEHHGTMTMSYFLNKAKEMGEAGIDTDDYRYPGPRPRIRETAIVMLADSVEAASRTLNEPKPSRIRNLVQNIINDRFQSGELEECPLTLKDLANIRESFVQILTGVFHHRIEYPEEEKKE